MHADTIGKFAEDGAENGEDRDQEEDVLVSQSGRVGKARGRSPRSQKVNRGQRAMQNGPSASPRSPPPRDMTRPCGEFKYTVLVLVCFLGVTPLVAFLVLQGHAPALALISPALVRNASEGVQVFEPLGQQAPTEAPAPLDVVTSTPEVFREPYTYTICNGLSNQMLGHAGNIAVAITLRRPVQIPNAFIINGVQETASEGGHALMDTLPTSENSVPLGAVFDTATLVEKIEKYGIKATLVPYEENVHGKLECSWIATLSTAKPTLAGEILKALVPSKVTKMLTDEIFDVLVGEAGSSIRGEKHPRSLEGGICLHHRDGPDWHKHCSIWENIPDGVWRKNCLEAGGRNLAELVQHRTSHLSRRWILYVGDHEAPAQLKQIDGVGLVTRKEEAYSSSSLIAQNKVTSFFTNKPFESIPRDLAAAIDYFLCSRLPYFIGNSVSTFSATQIARRDSLATWYNSRSIPLAPFFTVYFIPIVYTFTEEASAITKHMLKVSILSVRKHMPTSSIQVLYHGSDDTAFRAWLTKREVTLYDHQPKWRDKLKKLVGRHAENEAYFGKSQRIDIPLYLFAEYCLFLDAETIVAAPFSFSDFGLDIPAKLAVSSEIGKTPKPLNAGVLLMNLPFFRETLEGFHSFIFSHPGQELKSSWFYHEAYLKFYKEDLTLLQDEFNVKPHWNVPGTWQKRKIVHFHRLKPHDILQYWLEGKCGSSAAKHCEAYQDEPLLCDSVQHFAWTATVDPSIIPDYCHDIFPAWPSNSKLCVDFFEAISSQKQPVGPKCERYLKQVITKRGMKPDVFPNLR